MHASGKRNARRNFPRSRMRVYLIKGARARECHYLLLVLYFHESQTRACVCGWGGGGGDGETHNTHAPASLRASKSVQGALGEFLYGKILACKGDDSQEVVEYLPTASVVPRS